MKKKLIVVNQAWIVKENERERGRERKHEEGRERDKEREMMCLLPVFVWPALSDHHIKLFCFCGFQKQCYNYSGTSVH